MRTHIVGRLGPDYADAHTAAPGAAAYSGTLKRYSLPDNIAVQRRLYLLRQPDWLPVRTAVSDPVTGAYTFEPVDPAYRYAVVAIDHTGQYRAVMADGQTVGGGA